MAAVKNKDKSRLTLTAPTLTKTKISDKGKNLPAICCSLCHEEINSSEKNIKFIDCKSCLKKYHLECAGVNRIEYKNKDLIDSWVCSIGCIQSSSKIQPSKNIKTIQKLDQNNIQSSIIELQNQIKDLIEFQVTLSKKYDEIVLLNSQVNNPKEIKKDQRSLESNKTKDFSELKNEINLLKQYNIRKNIVIKGIYVKDEDDPLKIFMKISKFLEIDIYERDIEKVYVKNIYNKENQNDLNFSIIYVKFFDYQIKKFFTRARKGRKITPLDIEVTGLKNIIIEEQLTSESSYLLKESKNILRRYDCRFIWVLNGQICYRFSENLQHYTINSLSHLRDIERQFIKNC